MPISNLLVLAVTVGIYQITVVGITAQLVVLWNVVAPKCLVQEGVMQKSCHSDISRPIVLVSSRASRTPWELAKPLKQEQEEG